MVDKLSFLLKRRLKAISLIEKHIKKSTTLEIVNKDDFGYTEKYDDFHIIKINYEIGIYNWDIHIIFTDKFPDEPPKIRVPNAKNLYLKNPHVEEDGFLCIIPDSASINSDNIIIVFDHLISSTKEILNGTADADFREEFNSYWNRNLSSNSIESLLISSPEILKHEFYVFKGEKLICISEGETALNHWFTNRFSQDITLKLKKNGIIIKLQTPLLPHEYPDSILDVLSLSKMKDSHSYSLLCEKIVSSFDIIYVLLVQKTDNGYSLGGIYFSGLGLREYGRKLQKGFRIGKTPIFLLINRAKQQLEQEKVTRCKVKRVDYSWIHSRGGDGRTYFNKAVMIIGCGSLGGYIAHFLARAGVGRIKLFDNDVLEWANLGRHILGADFVDTSKAESLSKKLQQEMPHLYINGYFKDWREGLQEDDTIFNDVHIIIITVADWKCEKPLNILSRVKELPPILYTWLEPYAVAGHSFLSIPHSGCIECQMDSMGRFKKNVTSLNNPSLRREPGGCTHYQQYGPSALLPTVSMVSSSVLKHLIQLPSESLLQTWISDENHFKNVNAEITHSWAKRIHENGYSKIYNTVVKPETGCKACGKEKDT